MKITDTQLNIRRIQGVTKSTIPEHHVVCSKRHSDCFAYVFSGSATYRFGGRTVVAQTGDIVFLSCGSQYTIDLENLNFTTIFIDFCFERQAETVLENNVYKGSRIEKLDNTFIKLKRLWTIGNFSDKIYCCSLLYRIYSDIVLEGLFAYIPTARKQQLENAIALIAQKYSCPDFSMKELADSCNLSETHFRRLFMQIYHTSPKKFITSYRLDKAKQMLNRPDCSILEICKACGFESAYYFARVFKASIGMTPSEYRKSQIL